jgi:hypothetical protein
MSDDLTEEFGTNIPLFELLQTLRVELAASMNEARQQRNLRFALEAVDVELEVGLRCTRDRSGALKLGVIALSAAQKDDRSVRAKFKLELSPMVPGEPGKKIEVSDHSVGPLPPSPDDR